MNLKSKTLGNDKSIQKHKNKSEEIKNIGLKNLLLNRDVVIESSKEYTLKDFCEYVIDYDSDNFIQNNYFNYGKMIHDTINKNLL